jgi:CRP-like cAMP-binding protein
MTQPLDIISAPFEPHAVRIATRKRQKLSLAAEPDEVLYFIRKGIHLSRAPLPHEKHQILSILYPGDFVRALAVPPLEGAEIRAASETGEVLRVRWPTVKSLLDQSQGFARFISDRLADQAARAALHGAIIAGLTGDERVVALMIELALRTGKETDSGLMFEMPLSRLDIAEYLALNPDTVSRIVSRLRANGLLAAARRHHLLCPNSEALARACPLTPAIVRMHGNGGLLSV